MKLKLTCVILILSSLSSCSFRYTAVMEPDENGWTYDVNTRDKESFVRDYYWNGDLNDLTVTVPDTYLDTKVTSLGGYTGRGYPNPFNITLPEDFLDVDYGICSSMLNGMDDTEYETICFEVEVGANIKDFRNVNSPYYLYIKDSNGNYDILYYFDYYFTCSDENKYIYAQDGDLFDKETGENLLPWKNKKETSTDE